MVFLYLLRTLMRKKNRAPRVAMVGRKLSFTPPTERVQKKARTGSSSKKYQRNASSKKPRAPPTRFSKGKSPELEKGTIASKNMQDILVKVLFYINLIN